MANGQAICDKCKRFLREDGGCTHCERSVLMSEKLRDVTHEEAKKILSEPVEVTDKRGNKVVFSKEKLLTADGHLIGDHNSGDYSRRIRKLRYCIEAVRSGKSETQHRAYKGVVQQRTVYSKKFNDKNGKTFKAVAIASRNGEIKEVFTFYAD